MAGRRPRHDRRDAGGWAEGAPLVEPITASRLRPVARPVMLQGWRDLASVHWRYDPDLVQALLPDGFRVDTFDGSAWVGLIPFHMRRIRVPGLPALGPLSSFPETNLRTYIVSPTGRRGVWFASLDVTRLLPALVAQAAYRLPYGWARMSIDRTGDEVRYASRRRWPTSGAASDLKIAVGERIEPADVTELDHFLTARWALGSTLLGRLSWAEVDHGPWPLHRATVLDVSETLTTSAGLPAPSGDPHALWSPGVEVQIGAPRRLPASDRRRADGLTQELDRAS